MFVPPPVRSVGGGDRPAAVPMLARGLYLLHARHGKLPFENLVTKAEQLARFGVPVSRALARDLVLVAGPLFADPAARAVFGPGGTPLVEGQTMRQPELASTLAQMRISGVGDLYQGVLARRIQQASPAAGIPIGFADLRASLPSLVKPVVVPFGNDRVAFPPTDGGLAAAAALDGAEESACRRPGAWARSLAAAERWRAGGANSDQVLNGDLVAPAAVPLYPASTTFATLDKDGNAVICAVTMDNLFGTGRMVPGFGFLAAVSPAAVTPPLLATGTGVEPRQAGVSCRSGCQRSGRRRAGCRGGAREQCPLGSAHAEPRAGSRSRECDLLRPVFARFGVELRRRGGPKRIRARGRRAMTDLED